MNFNNLDSTDIFDKFFRKYVSQINLNATLNVCSSDYKGDDAKLLAAFRSLDEPNYKELDNTPFVGVVHKDSTCEIVCSVKCYAQCGFSEEEAFAIIAHELGHIERDIITCQPGGLEDEIEADKFAVKLGLKNELINALQKMIGAEINPDKEDEMNKRICELTKYP